LKIELYPCGIYRILRISDRMIISHLEELSLLIDGYISQNETHIAICFTDSSYMYSKAVAVLVSCVKRIQDANGDLCIIETQSEMIDLLEQMGIDGVLTVYSSENDLPDTFVPIIKKLA
jgi:anti-anti-sigma factor